MKMEQYKELLKENRIAILEYNLKHDAILKKFYKKVSEISYKERNNIESYKEWVVNIEEDRGLITYEFNFEGLNFEFQYKANDKSYWYNNKRYWSLNPICRKALCSYLCSLEDDYLVYGTYNKEKLLLKINKIVCNEIERLINQVKSICGENITDIAINNGSKVNSYNRSCATAFKGEKGEAIIWATYSGGEIQIQHIRMYVRKLTDNLRKEFDILF